MRQLERLRHLLRTLFRARRVERDLTDEADDWVVQLTERHQRAGLSAHDARRKALMELGGLEQMKEAARVTHNGHAADSTLQDVRYGWRALMRHAGFTWPALVTFGLRIGATTAIFSVVKTTIIDPLPYRDARRLMLVWADLTDLGYPHAPLAGPELVEFQTKTSHFERIGGVWSTTASIAGDGDPEQLRVATVTADFFQVLGVPAAIGAVIGPQHFGQPVRPILLSDALWRRRFGADLNVVGRKITVNDRPAIVVGVMPASFSLIFPSDGAVPADLQAWMPGGPRPSAEPRGQQYLRVVARLKPGASVKDGADDVAAVGAAMIRQFPGAYTPGSRFYAVSMQDDATATVRPALLAIFAGVCVLLVIACANVAGLLLVRAASRQKETAVRLALGASRGRLFRQYLVEGLLLSSVGALAGVAVAAAGLRALTALAPSSLARMADATIDPGVLIFAMTVAFTCGIAFSLAPMAEVVPTTLAALQREPRGSGRVVSQRQRSILVAGQIALSLILLVGAGLLARAFDRLLRVDPGFDGSNTLTFRIAPPFSRYSSQPAQNAFHRRLTEQLLALPGVTSVGAVSHLPYDNLPNWAFPYTREGETDPARQGLADARTVSPGFFEAVKARLLAGRFFTEEDQATRGELPVVIDDEMASRLWPGQNPINRAFPIDPSGSGTFSLSGRVIGVVGHLRHRSLTDRGREQVFVPARLYLRNPVAYVVRVSGDPNAIAGPVREAIKALDPALPIYDVRPLDDYFAAARAASRFTLTLAAIFSAVALFLACVGLYGVTAYAVDRRQREFGIRLALGAKPAWVLGIILKESTWITLAGLGAGLGGAVIVAGLLKSQLYGTTPYEPGVYATAMALLTAAVLAACLVPARRASRTGVMTILNDD